MFTFDAVIDAVQNSKKTFVTTFVKNEKMADAMNGFVNEQTEYTKKAVKATSDMATTVTSELVKAIQEAGKFDYSKFGEGIMKAYNAQAKK
jgi:predicted Zn-dependent protease